METQEDSKLMKPPSWKYQNYFPARYLISLMAFLGMTCNFMLNVNINFAIQAMVKPGNDTNGTIEDNDVCNFTDSDSGGSDYGGDFEWDEVIQGFVVGAFYWGYIWTQIPGGRLAEVYGPKIMMGCCLGTTSILCLFIPLAAHSSYGALIAVRVLQGLIQGPMYPIALVLVSAWAPPNERSMLTTFVCAGDSFGTIIAFPMAAAIADSINWEAIFYIQASISLAWVILWFLLISDDPKTFRFMTEAERKYITSSIGESKSGKSPPIPWRSIATSMPFWAMVIVGLGDSWGWYTLLTELPLYMKEMLKMDMATNALLSSMPYLGAWIFGLSSSIIGDNLLQSGKIKTGLLRKIAQTLAHMGPGISLLTLTFIQCDKTTSIVLFFVGIAFQGVAYVGFIANAVDIAPNFAGTLYGIVGMLSTIPGVIAPITVGVLTQGQQTFEQWNKVFYITFAIYCFDVVFYWIFGSGEEQPWNKVAGEDGLNLVEKQNDSDEPKQKLSNTDVGHDNLTFKDTEQDPIKVEVTKSLSSLEDTNIADEPSKVEITVYESSQDKLNTFAAPSKVEGEEQKSAREGQNQVEEPINVVSEEPESMQDQQNVEEIQIKVGDIDHEQNDVEGSNIIVTAEQGLQDEQNSMEGQGTNDEQTLEEKQIVVDNIKQDTEEQINLESIEPISSHDGINIVEEAKKAIDTIKEELTENEETQNSIDEHNLEEKQDSEEKSKLENIGPTSSKNDINVEEEPIKSIDTIQEEKSTDKNSLEEKQSHDEDPESLTPLDGHNLVEE